jgi:hypothetical protein
VADALEKGTRVGRNWQYSGDGVGVTEASLSQAAHPAVSTAHWSIRKEMLEGEA